MVTQAGNRMKIKAKLRPTLSHPLTDIPIPYHYSAGLSHPLGERVALPSTFFFLTLWRKTVVSWRLASIIFWHGLDGTLRLKAIKKTVG